MTAVATVDVLLPVYNGASTIEQSLKTLLLQSLREIRIIVVDDGSVDGTATILADIAASDDRVYVMTRPNRGIVATLNAGLRLCEAEFVARHDADDLSYPERLERQVDYLRAHPKVVAVSGVAVHIDATGRRLGTAARFGSTSLADPTSLPAKEPYLLHPFLMVRREVVVAAGGYRNVLHSEDSDLYWRLQEAGELHNLNDVLGEYRLHSESISGRSIANGRIMALSSQLGALSALRRRSGAPDLSFSAEEAAEVKTRSGSLELLIGGAGVNLSADEADHLRKAVSAKLLEFAGYRPYELEMADCIFIRRAILPDWLLIPEADRRHLRRTLTGTCARLLQKGMGREAVALVPLRFLPIVLSRLLTRLVLPKALYRRFQRLSRSRRPRA